MDFEAALKKKQEEISHNRAIGDAMYNMFARPTEHGIIGEAAAGFGRGVLNVLATPASLADVAGEALGWEGLEQTGEAIVEAKERYIEESPRLRKSESISGNILENPQLWTDPRWYASIASEGLPTIASMLIPGTAAAKIAKVAGYGAKGIKAARVAGGLGAGMGLEAGGAADQIRQYEEQTGETVPIKDKLFAVMGTGAVAGSLEYIPIFTLFGKKAATHLVSRILIGMASEGGTEPAQQLVANAFAKAGYDPDQRMVDGVVESIVGGVMLGGGMGAVSRATNFQERIDETDPDEVARILKQVEDELSRLQLPAPPEQQLLPAPPEQQLLPAPPERQLLPEPSPKLPAPQKIVPPIEAWEQAKAKRAEILKRKFQPSPRELLEKQKAARIKAKAELEPDINKFLRRGPEAEKRVEGRSSHIDNVIEQLLRGMPIAEAAKVADVWNKLWKTGTEAAKNRKMIEAQAIVRAKPELFELVRNINGDVEMMSPEEAKALPAGQGKEHFAAKAQEVKDQAIKKRLIADGIYGTKKGVAFKNKGTALLNKPHVEKDFGFKLEPVEIEGGWGLRMAEEDIVPARRPAAAKEPVRFEGMQPRIGKTAFPIVTEMTTTKSTVRYDPEKHEITNYAEYEKAMAEDTGEVTKMEDVLAAVEKAEKAKPLAAAPKFKNYDEVLAWVDDRAKSYESKSAFYASDEYLKAFSIIEKLYKKSEASKRKPEAPKTRTADVNYGDVSALMPLFGIEDTKQFSAKSTEQQEPSKPQETVTQSDFESIFSGMKNVTTGVNEAGNFFFKVGENKSVEILEVDHIKGYVNTSSGKIPIGSFLKNTVELKTTGVGPTADTSTVFHEFEHYLEDNNILSKDDINALNDAIGKKDATPEDRADYVGDNLADWQSHSNSKIRQILKKIADFMNAVYELVARTRTAKGVLRGIKSGEILAEKDKTLVGKKHGADELQTSLRATREPQRAKIERGNKVRIKDSFSYKMRRGEVGIVTIPSDDFIKDSWTVKLTDGSSVVVESKNLEILEPTRLPEITTEQNKKLITKFVNSNPVRQVTYPEEGDTFYRVIWGDVSDVIDFNDLDDVSLEGVGADKLRAIHVTEDPEFWSQKLQEDYGQEGAGTIIEVSAMDGDVLTDDPQYAIPEESGYKADSSILVTGRKILRRGKDFVVEGEKWEAYPDKQFQTRPSATEEVTVSTAGELAAELEANRTYANQIHAKKDLAVHEAKVKAAALERQIKELTGTGKRKGIIGRTLSAEEMKFNELAARKLSQAMFYYRESLINPEKGRAFENYAVRELMTAKGEMKIQLREQLETYRRSQKLTDKQKQFVDKTMDKAFDEVGQKAKDAGIIKKTIDNYVRRIIKLPDNWAGSGKYGFKTFTTASMKRKAETIYDHFMQGRDLKVSGLANAYLEIAEEVAVIAANKNFMKVSMNIGVFTTNKKPGHFPLKAAGFTVYARRAGAKIKTAPDEPGLLQVDTHGRKIFFAPPTVKYGATRIGKGRVSRYFETKEDAQAWVQKKGAGKYVIEKVQQANVFEKVPLYAPAQIATMVNKMTKTDSGMFESPIMKGLLRFNFAVKAWVLLSSFFHHMAGQRSWSFGVDHEIASALKKGQVVQAIKNIGTMLNSVSAHKRGLEKIKAGHAELSLLIKQGLTLGEMQDWDEALLREQGGLTETFARKLGAEKIVKGMEAVRVKREMFTNALFKRYFAGLKAEAAVIEFTLRVKKVQQEGKIPNTDAIAEQVARLINADFGGLHLARMGRGKDMQKMLRLLLLASDWTESNFRTFTGMVPGANKLINRLIDDMPPPPGMGKVYRNFWGGVIIKASIATVLAQAAASLWDDDEDKDWRKEEFLENFSRLKWTGVNVSGIYRSLGIDLDGNQRKVFSVVGHFADPLKIVHPEKLIKGKGSPLTRMAGAAMTKTDWRERPYTSFGEWMSTGKLKKKSRHEPKENFWEALPSIATDQVISMQPIQVGYMLRYLQGEEDGLSSLLSSAGAHITTAYKPSDVYEHSDQRKKARTLYKRYLDKGRKRKDLAKVADMVKKYSMSRLKSKDREDIPKLTMKSLSKMGKKYLKEKR